MTLYYKIRRFIRDFYYNMLHLKGNLKKWAVFVFNDRDWDYCYSMEALEIKCRAQAESLKNGLGDNDKQHAQEALELADALRRLINDDYCLEFYEGCGTFDDIKKTKLPDNYLEIYKARRQVDIDIFKNSVDKMFYWWD